MTGKQSNMGTAGPAGPGTTPHGLDPSVTRETTEPRAPSARRPAIDVGSSEEQH